MIKRIGNHYFENNSPIPYLNKRISNWEHFVVADTTFTRSDGNIVRMSGSQFLIKKLGIQYFPSYLVLDKNGVLIELPENGVNFIKKIVYNQSGFRIFWSTEKFKRQSVPMLIIGFVIYSIMYWLIILITFLIRKHIKSKANDLH